MTTLLVAILACDAEPTDSGGADTADTGDTADTADTAGTGSLDLATVLPSSMDRAWGCGWLYGVAQGGDHTLVTELALPVDEELRADFDQVVQLGAGDRLRVGGGTGADELDFFDCTDVMDVVSDVQVWSAIAASFTVRGTYLEDRPEWTCDGTGSNPVYDIEITVDDATFDDGHGATATLHGYGPVTVQAADFCGG